MTSSASLTFSSSMTFIDDSSITDFRLVFEHRTKAADVVPLGRWNDASDLVEAVMFLLGDQSHMINRVALPIDGGAMTQ
jgi:2-deoxy-D-gluconate 3-dehydrogenase